MSDVSLTTKHSRYDVLDGMRGIAAIMVMLSRFTHDDSVCGMLAFPAKNSTWLAVDFFFILSGFVIAHSYGKRLLTLEMSAREYLWRRVIRLYPMFLLGLLIGTPVLLWVTAQGYSSFSMGDVWRGSLYNAAFLPFFNAGEIQDIGAHRFSAHGDGFVFPSNPSGWSLFFEMVASIAFVSLIRMKRNVLIAIIAFCFAAMALNGFLAVFVAHGHFNAGVEQGWNTANFFGGFPRVFFGFSFGMLVYQLVRDNTFGAWLSAVGKKYINNSYILYLVLILVLLFPTGIKGLYPMFILAVVAPYLVFMGAKLQCGSETELKAAKFLGWLSYPLYCLHFPVLRAVFFAGKKYDVSFDVLVVISIVLTLGACLVLAKFVEEPTRRYLTRKFIGQGA